MKSDAVVAEIDPSDPVYLKYLAHFTPLQKQGEDERARTEPDRARMRRNFAVCLACDQHVKTGTCANCATGCASAGGQPLTQLSTCPVGKWDNPTLLDKPTWADLHDSAKGKTFLVIGRGPSRDEIDLNAIERDFTIATNLGLWEPAKQTMTKIDFDICADEAPCALSRPPGVKLVSNANTKGGREAREKAGAWLIFPHRVFKWGPIEKGQPLPTVFNSGVAALSFAIYVGAKHIKVVGIDHLPYGHGGMHANDAPDQRERAKKQYDGTFARVQQGITGVVGACVERGIKLEVLAGHGRLDWAQANPHEVTITVAPSLAGDEQLFDIALWHAGFKGARFQRTGMRLEVACVRR